MNKILFAVLSIVLFVQQIWPEEKKGDRSFKNLHLFKNLSEAELSRVMSFMRAGLGVHCDYCHVVGEKGWEWEKDEKPSKIKAREMISMVMELNRTSFKGEPVVSCFTCHQGRIRPNGTPPLPQNEPVYPTPVPESRVVNSDPKQILRQYAEATGGEHRSTIVNARSLILKGTTDETWKRKVVAYEVHYKAPDKWMVRKNLENGPLTYVLNGTNGWIQEGKETRIMAEEELALFRETIDSLQLLPKLPDAKPIAMTKRTINEREALALEFKLTEKASEFFYFDAQTHLLLGRKRYTISPVGSIPQEIQYLDYKELGGARIPHTVRCSYVDPWIGGNFTFTEILVNPPLKDTEFQMP